MEEISVYFKKNLIIHKKFRKYWHFRENNTFNKMSKNCKNKSFDEIFEISVECKKFDGSTET